METDHAGDCPNDGITYPSPSPPAPTKSPRVTIGISVYNAARTLPLTLRSIFCQTISDWELILVDDGSTDGSLDIMRAITDPRVRVFIDGKNKSLAPRLNEIARLANAPFLARMDHDDIMHPRRLEEQLAFMESHPEVDVVGSLAYSIDKTYRIRGMRVASRLPSSEFEVGMRGLFIHPTILGRAAWFLENPYDESAAAKPCEDAELWFRTFGRGTFDLIPHPLLFYMENPEGAIRRLRRANMGKIRIMYQGDGEVRKKRLSLRLAVTLGLGLKMAFYELCWATGASEYLIARRNQPIDRREAEAAYAWLRQVERCPVPGLT